MRRLAIFAAIATVAVSAIPPRPCAAGPPLRQLTNSLTDRLAEFAVDDAGEAVCAITTADPFGANVRHEFQVVRWDGAAWAWRVNADASSLERLIEGVAPALSGDGSTVVACTGANLVAIAWEGGSPTSLGGGSEPSITDDAGWVYYSSSDGDNTEIYRQTLAGGDAEQLTFTQPPLGNRNPVVSGANTVVTFTRSGGNDPIDVLRPSLMRMDPRGGRVESLIRMEGLWESWQPDTWADGRYVAYLGGAPGTNDIFHMRADGSDPVRVTHDADAAFPVLSGDGGADHLGFLAMGQEASHQRRRELGGLRLGPRSQRVGAGLPRSYGRHGLRADHG